MSGGLEVIPLIAIPIIMEIVRREREAGEERRQQRVAVVEDVHAQQFSLAREGFMQELRPVFLATFDRNSLMPVHSNRLRSEADTIQRALENAQTEREMARIALETPRLLADLEKALAVKKRSDQAIDPFARSADDDRRLREQLRTRERQAATRCAVNEFNALIAGLQSDEVIVRWHSAALKELEQSRRQITAADHPDEALQAAVQRAGVLIEEANAAELKARQRDYITGGIARSLAEMGFTVSEPQPEHPGHPATAKLLLAASPNGKEISVSVPVDGSVWYEVDGFHQETVAAVGGGHAVACDEAEGVLTEMHALLDQEFQVSMGDISWRGKDPNRVLRKADELPSAIPRGRGRSR